MPSGLRGLSQIKADQTESSQIKPAAGLEMWLALILSFPSNGIAWAALGVPNELAGTAGQTQSKPVKPTRVV
jgi:hypothetical protein